MAYLKLKQSEYTTINFKLETSDLPNYHILDYDAVKFKTSKSRYDKGTEILVVRCMDKNQTPPFAITYVMFNIKRSVLTNEIETLIQIIK